MSINGALAFLIYVDWLNAHGKSTWLASIGPIMLICVNLPPSERLKQENVYVSGIIPGLKEPTALQLNYLSIPLIKELKELWQGYHFPSTSMGPSGSFISVAILTAIANVVAMHKLTGFICHSGNQFCNFCSIHKAQNSRNWSSISLHTHTQIINQPFQNSFRNPHNKDKQFPLSMKCNIQFWKTFHIGMQPESLILT
ncbi:hypothetical protein O181_087327 [Austropuccinia psidii MF-1]|uniref:Uncharacterized protein n=1 Tax=Austropuccinia psidii MF-1 TaxID=1389203 RepID=A0A9Q3P2Y6_9BASI|nr:hypothetical protein [Austropuccinia psidii MF-1]